MTPTARRPDPSLRTALLCTLLTPALLAIAPLAPADEAPAADAAFWAAAVGGPNRDFASAVAVAPDGRVYVGGHFQGGIEDAAGRTVDSRGASDAFVATLAPGGRVTALTAFGGRGAEEVKALAVGAGGELYVGGFFSAEVDFDPRAGETRLASAGSADGFVARYEADGSLAWVRRFGGALGDVVLGLSPRPGGGVLAAGYFQGEADLDPGAGVHAATSAGRTDAFVAALDAAGDLAWATRFGGPGDDEAAGAVECTGGAGGDEGGRVYAVGRFERRAGFAAEAPPALDSRGRRDAFVAALDAAGGPLWLDRFGGGGDDRATAAACLAGGVVVGGSFEAAAGDDGSAPVLESAGRSDVFVRRYDAVGRLAGMQRLGGAGDDFSFAVVAGAGAIYVAAVAQELPDAAANRGPGPTGSFVARLDPALAGGGEPRVAFAADRGVQVLALALAADGSPVAAGTFQGAASVEPATPEAAPDAARRFTAAGKTDAFAARLGGLF